MNKGSTSKITSQKRPKVNGNTQSIKQNSNSPTPGALSTYENAITSYENDVKYDVTNQTQKMLRTESCNAVRVIYVVLYIKISAMCLLWKQ